MNQEEVLDWDKKTVSLSVGEEKVEPKDRKYRRRDELFILAKMSSTLPSAESANSITSASPSIITVEKVKASKKSPTAVTFQSGFSHILDARLLRGLSNLGHTHPTLVQAAVIPVALGGKSLAKGSKEELGLDENQDLGSGFRDLLVRARTGTGKTLAYGLPLMQKILDAKRVRLLFY